MVDIEIDEEQHEYLEQLRTELADEHVGDYGHVRYRDALQYLIDHYDATGGEVGAETEAVAEDESTGGDGAEGADGDAADDDTGEEATDDASEDAAEDDEADGTDAGGGGSASRLERMMGLLDDYDDVWEQNDGEEGRYAVTLPDGSTEQVRTKDDVRALLFQHYD